MEHNTHATKPGSVLRMARAIWRRRKWLAIVAFLTPFSIVVSMVMAMPDLYRATATVLIKQQPASEAMTGSPAAGELESRLQAISEEILSRSRLQDLIVRFDLYPRLRQRSSPEEVIKRMRQDIRLERKEVALRWGYGSTVAFTLSYQGWEPETVARVVNTLVSFYVEENERLRPHQSSGADLLARLKKQLAEQRTQFNEQYPDIVRLRAEIAALERERQASAHPRAGTTPFPAPASELTAMRQEIEAIERKEQRLREAIATSRQQNEDSLKQAQELEQRRRDYEATRELRASLSDRYEEARSIGTAPRQRGEQFRILDPAIPPSEPIAPNRIRLALMGLVLALGIAAGAVLLAEQLDTSFHRLDELWAFTRLPILTSVPRIVTRADTWRGRLRFGVASILVVSVLAVLVRVSYALGQAGEQIVWLLVNRGA